MRYDVIVVGAGPAGSVAAATLAAAGARVALLDHSHPREKPCGGGLTSRALELVEPLVGSASVSGTCIRAARFVDSRRRRDSVVGLNGGTGALLVSSRQELDSALLGAAITAGADMFATRVCRFEHNGQSTVITGDGRRLEASLVIGADGANSLVRRSYSRAFSRAQLSIATGFYAHGVTADEIVLEMVDEPAGYIWSFPRPDHLAIGICAQATDTGVVPLRAVVREWIDRTGIAAGAHLEPYSWPIPSLSETDFLSLPVAGRGWLTVGDAAGLVDPITREGIYFALQSGLFAADAISSMGARSVEARYTERIRDEIGADLAAAARLKAGFFRPRFTRLMLDALDASPKVRTVMADLVAGVQPYRTLKRRLLGTLEVGLAWRWLTGAQRTA